MEEIKQFKPGDSLSFSRVIHLREQVHSAIEEAALGFCFDLSEVTHCDSAGLALLIEARKLCQKMNKSFQVVGLSQETKALAEFCGLESILIGN